MPRLMACALTEAAVVARTKTVTRRLGWTFLRPGDRLTLCLKVQGRRRKDGTVEPLVRLAEVEVVNVRRERLDRFDPEDIESEGVPFEEWDRFRDHPAYYADTHPWVRWFCETMRVWPTFVVTRIEWKYL